MNNYKTDPKLGAKVEDALRMMQMQTPTTIDNNPIDLEAHFAAILTSIGSALDDDSLQDTPSRMAKMYGKELFYGMDPANFPKCTAVENKFGYRDLVTIRDINVKSVCEHHLMPIYGKATVAYIPNEHVMGLSKFNRVVDYFSRRPQVQERLTNQIGIALQTILHTEDIAVIITADHFCTKMRGVEQDSKTTTSALSGRFFTNPALRAELMGLI